MSDSPQTALMETRQLAGEVDLGARTEVLAELLMSVRERHTILGKVRKALEGELKDRMREHGRALLTVGGFELRLTYSNESVWDVDELDWVLNELYDEGKITAADTTGVIDREPTVNRKPADKLIKSLLGEARQRVEACRHWQKSTTPKLEVTRAVDLIPAEPPDPTAIEPLSAKVFISEKRGGSAKENHGN